MRVVLEIVLAGLKRGKARFLCAVVGIAAATGAIVFMTSLVATNAAQAPFAAQSAAVRAAGCAKGRAGQEGAAEDGPGEV